MGADRWVVQKVALVSTGSEILQGQYADSNACFLAEQLTLLGMKVTAIIAAPDDEVAIAKALKFAAEDADLIISTGGLGPTRDDLNRFVFERVFEASLKRDEKAVEQMARRFVTRGRGPMPEANEIQAMLPEGCIPFYNRWGTAPGFLLPPTHKGELGHCGLMALPGPPQEMVPMYREVGAPALATFLESKRIGGIRTVHTYGYAESQLGSLVSELFDAEPGVEFTILAKRHGVDLRVCATGDSIAKVNGTLERYEDLVRQKLTPEMVYGTDDDTLASAVGKLLKKQGLWVTTAESCTGGLVAQMLTEVSGSSGYVGECHVTYSNAAKTRVLGVQQKNLDMYGAVSEEVAAEMAEGARRISGADYAISVTGIAGPDGGTEDKPVGLVYISVAGPDGTDTCRNTFMGDRSGIRLHSAQTALNMLRLKLLAGINGLKASQPGT